MGWKLINEVLATDLPATPRAVLFVLTHRADEQTKTCFPSVDRLASDTGLCRRTVFNALQQLKREGHISPIKKVRKTNSYRVHPRRSNVEGGAADAPLGECEDNELVHDLHQRGASDASKPPPTRIESINNHNVDPLVFLENIARLANLRLTLMNRPRELMQIQLWFDEDFDLRLDIIPGILEAVGERPEATHSLKRFSSTIRRVNNERLSIQSRK